MLKYFLFFLISKVSFCSSLSVKMMDDHSTDKEEIISEILKIQETLILPLETVELPDFAQTGFLTVKMTPEYLRDFLNRGKMILAYQNNKMVGYLLLDKMEEYFGWARGREFESEGSLDSLADLYYIDQIAVFSQFAKQGVGKALVNYAKTLSPKGLVTDILFEPYPNKASEAFFAAQGFTSFGALHVEGNAIRATHKISIRVWFP